MFFKDIVNFSSEVSRLPLGLYLTLCIMTHFYTYLESIHSIDIFSKCVIASWEFFYFRKTRKNIIWKLSNAKYAAKNIRVLSSLQTFCNIRIIFKNKFILKVFA